MSTKHPTKKQLQALQLIEQGHSAHQAMIKAGYSEATARNPKTNLYKADGVLSAIERYQLELNNQGITTTYLAEKQRELLEATDKEGNPNHKVQLEALKLTQQNMELNNTTVKDGEVKRQWSYTEWVGEQEQGTISEAISPETPPNSLEREQSEELLPSF